MKGWIRISSHLTDCRNGKKESSGVSVFDWVDLPDWDLIQIWVWMRCGWFVVLFGVDFMRFGGMIVCCRFHDSDWISIISDAGRHYFRVSTAITLPRMPLNELWGGWEVVVCGTKRGVTCLYFRYLLFARAPMSSCEREMKWVLPVIVTYFLYSNAPGRYTSVRLGMSKRHFIVDENHSREWCDEDSGMRPYYLWVLWVWASLVNQFILISALRIISVVEASLPNMNASQPIIMEVNSGKSSQSFTSQSITLKHNTRTLLECIITKLKWFERRKV